MKDKGFSTPKGKEVQIYEKGLSTSNTKEGQTYEKDFTTSKGKEVGYSTPIKKVQHHVVLMDDLSAPPNFGKQDVQQIDPCNGMVFETMEAAKIFYNNYAKHKGFGISISDSRRIKDICIYRKFSCHKSGHAKRNKNTMRPRDSCKVGCQASVRVKLDKDTHKFTMYDVKIEHNHILQPAGVIYLRSHRKICTPEKAEIVNMRNVGIPPTKIMSAMARRSGGIRNLSWTEKDCRNFLDKERQTQLKDGDANTMLTYFQTMQAKDPTFLYNVALNENGTLRHVFWIDGRSRTACTYFSDVLCFDTTYLTNTYQMPFAPLVGVNHHGQSILLGCALLSNEKIDSFIWLFNCWLQANMGIHPKAIITDQDKAMEAAIVEVFPNTRHRFCLWHILKKIPEKIGHICISNLEFMNDFDACIYDSSSTHDFEEKWDVLMSKYESAKKNEWLEGLYECRKKWVPIFLKNVFFAGMSSSQRSESINHFFDGFVTAKTTLSEFVQKFALALERRFNAENEADMKSTDTEPFLKTSSPFEKQAADIYTRSIFQKFQQELIEVAACQPSLLTLDDTSFTLRVKSFEKVNFGGISKVVDKVCTVIYNKEQQEVECSCSCFQFKGYLCRHAISALQYSGIESIPEKYFIKRWRKDMRYRHASDSFNIPIDADKPSSSLSRYNLLIYHFMKVAEAASCTEESYDKTLAEIPNLLARVIQPVNNNTVQSIVKNTQVADPPRAATKGRKREKRIQSALEKIRKRSRSSKQFNKNSDINAPERRDIGGVTTVAEMSFFATQ